MIDSYEALDRFCDLRMLNGSFLDEFFVDIDWDQLADEVPYILGGTNVYPYGLGEPSLAQLTWNRGIEAGRDHRPITEQAETLRYRFGIPKRRHDEWLDRLTRGERPEDVAADLSAWQRFNPAAAEQRNTTP
ncbi:hypothetical protein [Gordonia tangerina]|uniref:Uncharacterized protein n=1 Tax=Gordonia tangerina TaxID=2911060 RepID=A0ABS9DGZ9_9ACTN|nr:hypothetical protein [Gordonia tangerina]MCF3938387.1 hypothetical protein [Gordonia tangerina]